jgi:hypothetical protein
MNNQKQIVTEGVEISRALWDVPVQVEVRSYLRFSRRMDNQLRRLVIHWQHTASPWARGKPIAQEQENPSAPPIF